MCMHSGVTTITIILLGLSPLPMNLLDGKAACLITPTLYVAKISNSLPPPTWFRIVVHLEGELADPLRRVHFVFWLELRDSKLT